MAGFNRDTMYADNVDFTGSTQPSAQVTADGQLLIGSGVAPNIRVATLTAGTGVSITNGAGSITIGLSGAGQAVDSIGVQTGTNPIAPTVAGLVTINGAVVAAGTNPVRSDGTGANTMALEVQISQALAATDATKIGLSNFDSAAFDVDANGFVTLNGGGIAATSFDVQAATAPGTDPVVPSASGVVTVNGAAVAAHSVPIETRSRAANAYNVEVQYSAAVAATDATKSGIAHFDSAAFDVDANGFVTLNGGGVGITSVNVDAATPPGTDPVVASATGEITITGAQVATGTIGANVIRTDSLAANTLAIEIQRTTAVAATDSTKNGVSHFDSASFAVDANGFVTLAASSGVSLSPYIVGPTNSDFTSIQDAIDQAVLDGASNSNQINIYVKPDTYTENLTLSDGINLIGFPNSQVILNGAISNPNSAVIVGTVTLGAAQTSSISGLNITPALNADVFTISGNSVNLKTNNCNFTTTGTGIVFDVQGTNFVFFSNSDSCVSAGALFEIGIGESFHPRMNNTFWQSGATSNTSNGIFSAITEKCSFSNINIDASSANALAVTWTATRCVFSVSAPFIDGGTNCPITLTFKDCLGNLSSTGLIVNDGTGSILSFVGQEAISSSSDMVTNTGTYSLSKKLCGGPSGTFSINKFYNQYIGSDYVEQQAVVQTTNATVTTLASVTVNELESITFKGQITGAQSNHTNAIGGDFLISARRASGGNVTIVGVAIVNVNSSSTATFTADVDTGTQTVRIRVTGVAATTYNWVTTTAYQKVLTNA